MEEVDVGVMRADSPEVLTAAALAVAGTNRPVEADHDRLLPPRATADGTLRRLLLSALVGFAERGYHAVPVREIAEGAGVRASSMYEHRASKEDLLVDLIRIGHEEHYERLMAATAAAGPRPDDRLVAFVREHVLVHAEYPMLTTVCNRELRSVSPERAEEALASRQRTLDLLTGVIDDGAAPGMFSPRNTLMATAAIGAMGIRVAEWYRPDLGIPVAELADTYALFALRLVGCRQPDAVVARG